MRFSPDMTTFSPMAGGENLVDQAIALNPGELLYSLNHEVTETGYRRIDGYERSDGRTKPSVVPYHRLRFDQGGVAVVAGSTVTGATSGATGVALVNEVVTSGAWATSDAAGSMILMDVSGVFVDNEALRVAAVTVAVADGVVAQNGADNDTDYATWRQAAIEYQRAKIAKPPGSGPVRGGVMLDGVNYVFRDNVGGTAGVMYKATAAGWVPVDLGAELAFNLGTATFSEGQTVTGATSGATGIIAALELVSGDWTTLDAAGRLCLHTVTGTFSAAENITSAGGAAKAVGAQVANVLPPGGRYEFDVHNFYAATGRKKVYGCNGVGFSFQFNATGFAFIKTGMAVDKPIHIIAHKSHLFLAFPGGSNQHSSIGEPMQWSVITGAAELGAGAEITGYSITPGDVLAIFCRNRTNLLHGTSAADWNMVTHSPEAGAVEWTVQNIGTAKYLDDRGITSLEAVQAFGDFKANSISRKVQPLIDDLRLKAIASMRVRKKGQYRLFFNDGYGIYCSMVGDKVLGFTRVLFPNKVACTWSAEDATGTERLFFGSDDGVVYELDSGTSFDGAEVGAYLRMPFNHLKSPRNKKRFRKVVVELDSPGACPLKFLVDFDYSNPNTPIAEEQNFIVQSGGGYWGLAVWGEFIWGGQPIGEADAAIDGSGKNMSILISSRMTYELPYTIQSIILHYTMRGIVR